ncbi:MAG: hypothetical protein GC157_03405 [Frankiales bacterium]|nr:hypothetical protein [Frankiales bacterium]
MRRAGPAAAATAVLAIALALTGCSSKSPDALTVGGASTLDASSGATDPSVSATPTDSSPTPSDTPTPAPEPLTKAQATAALPPASTLGSGWKIDQQSAPGTTSSSKTTYSPKSCQAIFDALNSNATGKPAAKADRSYQRALFGPFVTVTVESYPQPLDTSAFGKIASAFTACPTFTALDSKGQTTTFHITALKFPNLGDQTFAFQLNATSSGFPFTAQFAITAVGNNAITVAHIVLGTGLAPGLTQKVMRATLKRLP